MDLRHVFWALVIGTLCSKAAALTEAPIAVIPQTQPIQAEPAPTPGPSITEQRYHYELAKSALARKDMDRFEENYAKLGDYPLLPYLDYSLIRQNLYAFEFARIDAFLDNNRDTFLGYRLREQLLHALAKKSKWRHFAKYYSPAIRGTSMHCHHLYARIAIGDVSAYDDVATIWVKGKSQPKACDPLFKKWRRHGGISSELAWTRFTNAMAKRKTGLARYVMRYMNEAHKTYAENFLAVHNYPPAIAQHRRFSEQSLKNQQLIAHGIKRYARQSVEKALYAWELYEAQQLFPKELSTDVETYLVKRLTSKGHADKAEALVRQAPEIQQRDVLERLIREALRSSQYSKVLDWIALLDEEAQQSDRWRYWRARAQDELGIHNANKPSITIYQALSNKRSFYGFLSSDILNRAYSLEHKPSAVNPNTEQWVQALPAIQRARELYLRQNYHEAQAEWRFATRSMTAEQLAAAGSVARQWGWYNKGIHAMIRGQWWDDLDVRFPLAYRDTIEQVASDMAIEQNLIYAIARQESAFSEKARSSAGAMGLMQLMPGTARQTARKSGIRHSDRFLYNPEYNIRLGTRYLDELLTKFKGNRILATAAYNAGPHRVAQWLKKTSLDVPFDVWIETIPFKETRGYVQNVLAFSVIYSYRMGKPSQFITERELSNSL